MTEDLHNNIPPIDNSIIGIINDMTNWSKMYGWLWSITGDGVTQDCRNEIRLAMPKYTNDPAIAKIKYGLLGMFFLFRIR